MVSDDGERDQALLRALEDHGERFTWAEIAPLASRGQPALDAYLVALLEPADGAAVPWLLGCALRAGQAQMVNAGWGAEALLDQLLARVRSEDLTPRDRDRCRALIDVIQRRLIVAEELLLEAFLEEEGYPINPSAEAEVREFRQSDWFQRELRQSSWYQRDTQRIKELRRVLGEGDQ